jgi:hypothetical protein
LGSDQRGQERPAGGADIGAFELCVVGLPPLDEPCLITEPFEEGTVTLTIAASGGSGTTTPAPGAVEEGQNTVVQVAAQANAGYYFVNWTGDVTDPSSASTFVVMDGPKSVAANFALIPDFSLSAGPVSVLLGASQTTTVSGTANAAFNQTVTFSTANVPAGITPSFSPGSVLLAPGVSQTSELTVSIAPFVLPGTYAFTVVATALNVPGPFPTTVRSVAVTVTVVATPAAVAGVIDALADPAAGCIDSLGVANAFKAKLAVAQALLDAGQLQQALNTLAALLRQLHAQQGKHLATECVVEGQPVDPTALLIAQVQAIVDGFGGALQPDPILGTVVDASGQDIAGAVVSISSGSKKAIASTTTDATGFYYFAATKGLTTGSTYTVSVALPKGYQSASPASQSLRWRAVEAILASFVLY